MVKRQMVKRQTDEKRDVANVIELWFAEYLESLGETYPLGHLREATHKLKEYLEGEHDGPAGGVIETWYQSHIAVPMHASHDLEPLRAAVDVLKEQVDPQGFDNS